MATEDGMQGFTGRVRASTSLEGALDAFVGHVAKGDSGRHRGEVDRVIGDFVERAQRRGAEDVREIGQRQLEQYADHLARRSWAREEDPDAGITGRTTHQYYARPLVLDVPRRSRRPRVQPRRVDGRRRRHPRPVGRCTWGRRPAVLECLDARVDRPVDGLADRGRDRPWLARRRSGDPRPRDRCDARLLRGAGCGVNPRPPEHAPERVAVARRRSR